MLEQKIDELTSKLEELIQVLVVGSPKAIVQQVEIAKEAIETPKKTKAKTGIPSFAQEAPAVVVSNTPDLKSSELFEQETPITNDDVREVAKKLVDALGSPAEVTAIVLASGFKKISEIPSARLPELYMLLNSRLSEVKKA